MKEIIKKKKWRIIKDIEAEGAMQMAIDEAILFSRIKDNIPNTLRFFKWKPSCLTIGYFQSIEKEIDIKKAKKQGVDIVRRYTGGGAVFHDKELTYSIAISEKDIPKDVIESYKVICSALTKGLNLLKIHAEFKPINDIIIGNKKISGNAQTRRNGCVLQHGTILLDIDIKKMFSLLKVPDEKIKDKMIKIAEERVTSLKKELLTEITFEELKLAIIKGFENTFDTRFEYGELTDYELKLSQKLYKEKYVAKEWNYLR